jgi:hypothetical protein
VGKNKSLSCAGCSLLSASEMTAIKQTLTIFVYLVLIFIYIIKLISSAVFYQRICSFQKGSCSVTGQIAATAFSVLYIRGLFNDAFSSSEYMAQNDWMVNE